MEKTLYDLKLHEVNVVNPNIIVMRVPGGWIYKSNSVSSTSLIFVPYNDEFIKHENC